MREYTQVVFYSQLATWRLRSLVPRRSLLIRCPREVWERAGERTRANIGKIPPILAQFSSLNVCVSQKLLPDGVEVSRNAGKS